MMIMLGFGCQIKKQRTSELLIAMSREKWNPQQHRLAGNKVIAMGDVVYHSIQEVATKIHPRFEGPCRVIGIEHGNKIKIRHLTEYNTKIVHVDHLKRVSRNMDDGEQLPSPKPSASASKQALPSTSLEYRKIKIFQNFAQCGEEVRLPMES